MSEASVAVDHGTCIVSGMCAAVAPEIFDVDDAGLKVEVLKPVVTGGLVDEARNAEACCPVEAIAVVES